MSKKIAVLILFAYFFSIYSQNTRVTSGVSTATATGHLGIGTLSPTGLIQVNSFGVYGSPLNTELIISRTLNSNNVIAHPNYF